MCGGGCKGFVRGGGCRYRGVGVVDQDVWGWV